MKVKIRPLRIEDAYTSVKWRNDSDVFRFTGNTYDHEITIDSELEWIQKAIADPKDYRCAIIADDTYVGNIYLTDIKDSIGHYHIFIGDRSYWGKGIGKEASILIINYGFNEIGLKEIKLRVNKANISALSLYKKLGFKEIDKDEVWFTMSLTK